MFFSTSLTYLSLSVHFILLRGFDKELDKDFPQVNYFCFSNGFQNIFQNFYTQTSLKNGNITEKKFACNIIFLKFNLRGSFLFSV